MTSNLQANSFKLVGGSLSLDFVNTAGGWYLTRKEKDARNYGDTVLKDKLSGYPDLVAWGKHTGLLSDKEARELLRLAEKQSKAAGAVFKRGLGLRETIYRIFKCVIEDWRPDSTDIARFNEELFIARSHQKLAPSGKKLSWGWDDPAGDLDRMLWPVALSAAELLTSGNLSRVRQCGGAECAWLFLDTSRNRSRQWCDMKDCGNLAKVRRFRQRRQDAN